MIVSIYTKFNCMKTENQNIVRKICEPRLRASQPIGRQRLADGAAPKLYMNAVSEANFPGNL